MIPRLITSLILLNAVSLCAGSEKANPADGFSKRRLSPELKSPRIAPECKEEFEKCLLDALELSEPSRTESIQECDEELKRCHQRTPSSPEMW